MEEFSLKLLDEGMGFYEKNPVGVLRKEQAEKEPVIPAREAESFLEELNWEEQDSYKRLLAFLEKPYLGDSFLPEPSPPAGRDWVSEKRVPPSENTEEIKDKPAETKETNSVLSEEEKPEKKKKEPGLSPSPAEEKKSPEPATDFEKTFYFSLKAYLTDAFVVSTLFFPSFFLFVFLSQPEPMNVLKTVWPQTLIVFFLFAQVYCLLCRLFCFETFGEALARLRLYTLHSPKEVHPFRFCLRFLLSCVTGFFLIPFLSFVFRKDFMARCTGLYFQKT